MYVSQRVCGIVTERPEMVSDNLNCTGAARIQMPQPVALDWYTDTELHGGAVGSAALHYAQLVRQSR